MRNLPKPNCFQSSHFHSVVFSCGFPAGVASVNVNENLSWFANWVKTEAPELVASESPRSSRGIEVISYPCILVCVRVCVSETVFVSLMKGSGSFFFFLHVRVWSCLLKVLLRWLLIRKTVTHRAFLSCFWSQQWSAKRDYLIHCRPLMLLRKQVFFSFSFSVNEIVFHCL